MAQEKLYTEGLMFMRISTPKNSNVIEILFKKSSKRTKIIKKIAQFFDKQASEQDYTDKNICDILKQVIYAPPGVLEKFVPGDLVDKKEQKRIWDAIFRNVECMKIPIKSNQDELLKNCNEYLKAQLLSNTFPENLAKEIVTYTPDVQVKEEIECCHDNKNDLDTNLSLSSILENCSKENEFEDDNEKDLEMFRKVSASLEDVETQIKAYSHLLK